MDKIDFNNLSLTEKYILSHISEKDIFDFYIKQPYKFGELLKSNLRDDDDTNSLNIFIRNNQLRYKDFGHSYGNCFEYVKNLYHCDYFKALEIIAQDFNLIPGSTPKPTIKPIITIEEPFKKVITPIKRGWKLLDKEYWTDRYYIPIELLIEYDIYAAQYVYLKNKIDNIFIWGTHQDNNPIYVYQIDDTHKCYRPLCNDKRSKWISTTTSNDIQGMKQLSKRGELLIITSSMKDVLMLKVLGYNAIALNGEGCDIPDNILNYLYASYDNIIVFYDNDQPGINGAIRLSEKISSGYIHIPLEYKEKDISDFVEKYRLEEGNKLMKQLI